MTSNPSVSLLNEVFEAVTGLGEASINDVATLVDRHPTTVGVALNHHFKRGKLSRTGRRLPGNPRETLFYTTTRLDAAEPVAPAKSPRVKRNTGTQSVRDALAGRSPNGKPFTQADVAKKIGVISRETVRKAFVELEKYGEVVYTGKCRDKARLYRVTAPAAQPVTTPAASVTTTLVTTSLDDLLAEKSEIQARMAADEKRLVQIDMTLDEYRAKLGL